jgi:AcrR family transcriptional regulator
MVAARAEGDARRPPGPAKATGGKAPAKKRSAAATASARRPRARSGQGVAPFDGTLDAGGGPASRRALRNQGRRTMRKLLDAAMVAFDRRGYHATRVNDVVELAKTSHGTFYLYFSNKEDLLRALVAEAAGEVQGLYQAMAEAADGQASWESQREWIGRYSALWVRYAPLLRSWTDLATVDPDLGDMIRLTVSRMAGAIAQQVRRADPPSNVDPESAGMAILAMLDRFHYLREFVGQPVDDEALDTLATLIHRSCFQNTGP